MKLLVTISDELGSRLKRHVRRAYRGKRGALSIVVERALNEYLELAEILDQLESEELRRREREILERALKRSEK